MHVDHVLVAIADLGRGASAFEAQYRLASVEGGRHPGWGTANRIVPLGNAYLELIAVVDTDAAGRSTIGRWVLDTAPGRPIGWAVRTTDLDGVAGRLGLAITTGRRDTPDGRAITWRSAGIEEAVTEPTLPFFIEWGAGVAHPGSAPPSIGGVTARLRRLVVSGDAARLADWLGDADLPVEVTPGRPAVTSVALATPRGEIEVR